VYASSWVNVESAFFGFAQNGSPIHTSLIVENP
jgi:hypothetical protein